MPYARSYRRRSTRRPARKNNFRKTTRNGSTFNRKVSTIAKRAVMRTAETKSVFVNMGAAPIALFHNTPKNLDSGSNLLRTLQGTQDAYTSGAFLARIGDAVTPIGIKLFLTIQQPIDKPNVTYRLIVQKTRTTGSGTIALPLKNVTGVTVVDQLDTEHQDGRAIMQRRFADRSMSYSRHDTTSSHNSVLTFVKTFWVPLPQQQYRYSADNGYNGRDYNIHAWLAAYDGFGTLTTDQVASVRFAYRFYFKDV